LTLVADLIRAGVDPDLVARVASEVQEAFERGAAACAPVQTVTPTARQERNRRYYEAKKGRLKPSENKTVKTNKTLSDAETPSPSSSPSHSPTNNPLPQSSLRSDSVSASARREIDREFEERFWPEWPNRSSKDAAKKAYPKARQIASLEQILSGVRLYRLHKPADRDWMHAATFLNGKRWNDEYSGFNARAGPFERPAKRNTAFAVFERMRDDEPPDENPAPPRSAFG
jgi:hypothetical protein